MATHNLNRHGCHLGNRQRIQTSSWCTLMKSIPGDYTIKKQAQKEGFLKTFPSPENYEHPSEAQIQRAPRLHICLSAFCQNFWPLQIDFQWAGSTSPSNWARLDLPAYAAWAQARTCCQNSISLAPRSASLICWVVPDQMTPATLLCWQKSEWWVRSVSHQV